MIKDESKVDTDFYRRTLSQAIQHKLNISDYRRDKIIDYVRLVAKGPDDVCEVLKEIPLNFSVGNDKYFAIYILTLLVANYYENIKKGKRDKFVDNISNNVAKCFNLDLGKLTKILFNFGEEDLEKIISGDALKTIINGTFNDDEKMALMFLYYFATLAAFQT